jgi:hypothetical protein
MVKDPRLIAHKKPGLQIKIKGAQDIADSIDNNRILINLRYDERFELGGKPFEHTSRTK